MYCKRITVVVYEIWQKLGFDQVGMELNWRIAEYDYSFTHTHGI